MELYLAEKTREETEYELRQRIRKIASIAGVRGELRWVHPDHALTLKALTLKGGATRTKPACFDVSGERYSHYSRDIEAKLLALG
ncbi:MAG: hypothetical protein GDA56_11145 [Hormoscilla sp. GM7CHS1pb]|nr:hypothetical protein [Hormoscilla sp. GM7CHS1pb]